MASRWCKGDSIALFIANVLEQADNHDVFTVCDYGERWFLDLLEDFCLWEDYTMTGGVADELQENIAERLPVAIYKNAINGVKLRTKFDRFMQAARYWRRDNHRNNSLWLYHMVEGEAGLRRSLIHSMIPNDRFLSLPANNQFSLRVNPQVVRHFCWETPDRLEETITEGPLPTEPFQNRTGTQFFGTAYPLPAINGTEDGRISELTLFDEITQLGVLSDPWVPANNTQTSVHHIWSNTWVGIKEDVGCGIDDWNPLMELGPTALSRQDPLGSLVPDAQASGGQAMFFADHSCPDRLPYAGATLAGNFPGANLEQWRGEYIVLLRARTGAAGYRYETTLRYGFLDTDSKIDADEPQYIENTKYAWYPIGVVDIPADDGRIAASKNLVDRLSSYGFEIHVRIDQAGTPDGNEGIYLDCLYLIPNERHAIAYFEDETIPPFMINNASQTNALRLFTHEDDTTSERYLLNSNPGVQNTPLSVHTLIQNNFYRPLRESRFVMAANAIEFEYDFTTLCESTIGPIAPIRFRYRNEIDWTLTARMDYYERWLSYRDA